MLQYGAAYSRCPRRVAGGFFSPGYPLHRHTNGVDSLNASTMAGCAAPRGTAGSALYTALRSKSTSILIANRKKVEMFVGKHYHLPTRLRTAAPDIALEWDYEKNPMHLYPEIVSIGYMYPVFWTCRDCGHSYKMSVEKRVVRGSGCPMCEEREANRFRAQNQSFIERHLNEATEETADVSGSGEKPPLLHGEENRALRPKRAPMLNLRTKY